MVFTLVHNESQGFHGKLPLSTPIGKQSIGLLLLCLRFFENTKIKSEGALNAI